MTGRMIDFPGRVFQVWGYTAGMGRLLLRSTKSETFPTRVDVLFQNVKAMSLPTMLEGLVVAAAGEAAAARFTRETGLLVDENATLFELATARGIGYVVAGVVVAEEDHGEYFEPSKYWPGPQAETGNP